MQSGVLYGDRVVPEYVLLFCFFFLSLSFFFSAAETGLWTDYLPTGQVLLGKIVAT